MKKALLSSLVFAAALANAAEYKLDPAHANARFGIDHFGTSTNRAAIHNLEGSMEFDSESKTGKIDVTLPVNNISSGNQHFDKHLKSADIFDVEQFPEIRFVSEKFNVKDDKLESVEGQLTMKGKTAPVTLKAEKFNCYDSPMAKTQVCGGDFIATIDRSQWGVDYLIDKGFAKEVDIVIQIEALKQ